HKFLEEAIEAYTIDHRAFPDPSKPEALQPYIQKVSEETGWDSTDPPEWEILEEKNAVYIHTRGSGGSANPTLPKDQPWFLTLYGMEGIERRIDIEELEELSATDSKGHISRSDGREVMTLARMERYHHEHQDLQIVDATEIFDLGTVQIQLLGLVTSDGNYWNLEGEPLKPNSWLNDNLRRFEWYVGEWEKEN
ncbi:MAG: hypothetical protein KC994_27345, partial [Candidatus Omnitrophica bacterium]|nr:hypothetical protein [Candidatus Omnitrophota bacterium]